MLFLEKGHACAFRTTFVVEGELGCTAASMVNGREPLPLPLVEDPPIPRAMELKTTSPINAIARANARRRLRDATRSVWQMRAALCEGIGSPAKANYDVPRTPHGTGSEKGRTERVSRISEWVNGPKTYCLGTVTRVQMHTRMHRAIRPANFMRSWTIDDVVRDAGEPADPARKVERPRVSPRRRRRDWRGHTRSCRSSSSCGAGAPPSSPRRMTSTSSLSKS